MSTEKQFQTFFEGKFKECKLDIVYDCDTLYFDPHRKTAAETKEPAFIAKSGKFKYFLSRDTVNEQGNVLTTGMVVRDFFGCHNQAALYTTAGVASKHADAVIRKCVEHAKAALYLPAPLGGYKHVGVLNDLANVAIFPNYDESIREYGSVNPALYTDFDHNMSVELNVKGHFAKIRILNVIESGGATYVDFFMPEIVEFLKQINIHLLNTKYNVPLLTIDNKCTHVLDNSMDFF
jgi:hypothetical protein